MSQAADGHRVSSKEPVEWLEGFEAAPEVKRSPPLKRKKAPEPEPEPEEDEEEDGQWFPDTKRALDYKQFMKRKDVNEHYPGYRERQAAWKAYQEWLDEDDD